MRISGWIFDAYLTGEGISLWILDQGGKMHALLYRWQPRLFAREGPKLVRFLARNRIPITQRTTEREDFFTHEKVAVREIRVTNPLRYNDFVNKIQEVGNLELF